MGLTTRIRFTEPIDPRKVWARVLEQIKPPADYKWSYIPIGGNQIAWRNPLIYAESGQGALVWAYVMYGQDGCKLVEDDDTEDYPPAFVEVSLISDWTQTGLHDSITEDLVTWGNDAMGLTCLQTAVWTMDDHSNGWWPTS